MDCFNQLDNMCEVVLEEGDEYNVPLPTSSPSSSYLPPTPTFDLQTEQYTYMPVPTATMSFPPPVKNTLQTSKFTKIAPKPQEKILIKPRPADVVLDQAAEIAAFVGKLFQKKDRIHITPDRYPKNLNQITNDELLFYKRVFSDASKVELCRVHCTICDRHLGCKRGAPMKSHRMLAVLVCKACYDFYGDGKFPKDKSDDTEIYCRWCGQGGGLVCCSFCPMVFCYKCIKRNFSIKYLREIQAVDEWACFCCAQTPLWPLRAVCRALLIYLKTATIVDKSLCCEKKKHLIKSRNFQTANPTNHIAPAVKSPNPPRPPMVVFQDISSPPPPKQIIYQPTTRILLQTTPPVTPPQPPPPQPPRPPPPSSPPLTPAYAMRSHRQPVQLPASKVPAKMPDVFVDHSNQEMMIVRMRMPKSKEQYLRVNVTGSCLRIPSLPVSASFPIQSLKHAFRANRMAHNRLLKIKKKSEECNDNSELAEALLGVLERWKKVIGLIEDDLQHNLRISCKKKDADVIDLDIDEELQWTFESRSGQVFEDDSDVEIIDFEDVARTSTKTTNKRRRDSNDNLQPPKSKMKKGDVTDGMVEVDSLTVEGKSDEKQEEKLSNPSIKEMNTSAVNGEIYDDEDAAMSMDCFDVTDDSLDEEKHGESIESDFQKAENEAAKQKTFETSQEKEENTELRKEKPEIIKNNEEEDEIVGDNADDERKGTKSSDRVTNTEGEEEKKSSKNVGLKKNQTFKEYTKNSFEKILHSFEHVIVEKVKANVEKEKTMKSRSRDIEEGETTLPNVTEDPINARMGDATKCAEAEIGLEREHQKASKNEGEEIKNNGDEGIDTKHSPQKGIEEGDISFEAIVRPDGSQSQFEDVKGGDIKKQEKDSFILLDETLKILESQAQNKEDTTLALEREKLPEDIDHVDVDDPSERIISGT